MNSREEAVRSGSLISCPHSGHPPPAALAPVLASALHTSVDDVTVSGFNNARANEPSIGEVDVIAHSILIGSVVTNEFGQGF